MWGIEDSYPQVETRIGCNKRYTFCYTRAGGPAPSVQTAFYQRFHAQSALWVQTTLRNHPKHAKSQVRADMGDFPPSVTKGIPFVTAAAGKSGAPGQEIGNLVSRDMPGPGNRRASPVPTARSLAGAASPAKRGGAAPAQRCAAGRAQDAPAPLKTREGNVSLSLSKKGGCT